MPQAHREASTGCSMCFQAHQAHSCMREAGTTHREVCGIRCRRTRTRRAGACSQRSGSPRGGSGTVMRSMGRMRWCRRLPRGSRRRSSSTTRACTTPPRSTSSRPWWTSTATPSSSPSTSAAAPSATRRLLPGCSRLSPPFPSELSRVDPATFPDPGGTWPIPCICPWAALCVQLRLSVNVGVPEGTGPTRRTALPASWFRLSVHSHSFTGSCVRYWLVAHTAAAALAWGWHARGRDVGPRVQVHALRALGAAKRAGQAALPCGAGGALERHWGTSLARCRRCCGLQAHAGQQAH